MIITRLYYTYGENMSINRNYLLISGIIALLLVFGGLVTVLSGTGNGIDAGTQDQNGKKFR